MNGGRRLLSLSVTNLSDRQLPGVRLRLSNGTWKAPRDVEVWALGPHETREFDLASGEVWMLGPDFELKVESADARRSSAYTAADLAAD